jgi:hypothetical protein
MNRSSGEAYAAAQLLLSSRPLDKPEVMSWSVGLKTDPTPHLYLVAEAFQPPGSQNAGLIFLYVKGQPHPMK